MISPISPDDSAVLTGFVRPTEDDIEVDVGFLNIQDGSIVPANSFLEEFLPLSNIVWRDGTTAAFLALDASFNPALALIDRRTGATSSEVLDELPGFPISLAPDASGLLIAVEPEEEEDEDEGAPDGDQPPIESSVESPFDLRVQLRPPRTSITDVLDPFLKYQEEADDEVEVASVEIELAYLDLRTGQVTTLLGLPEGSGLTSMPAWSPDGSKLAMTRITLEDLDLSRGQVSLANLVTRDTLGTIPPAENDLLQSNVVDIFDLSGGSVEVSQIRAADENGDTFAGVSWSTDGFTLLTKMHRPGRLAGRAYPTYLYAESSYIRFYDVATERVIGVFSAPEISAPNFSTPMFVTPDEVIFTSVRGLSMRLYYYNRVSGELREISDRNGMYGQIFMGGQVLATRFSRQLVFRYSSFQTPPELYRIGWDGQAFAALTYNNVEVAELNQVQANELSFTLQDGSVRQGYLVQPAGAAFPPQNEPIIVWQEGGPGLFMVNQWFANVENPFNLLPNFGFSLLVLPLPGREGWGPEFYNALADDDNFGAVDVDEGAQVVRQMIARGYTSPDRIGITGCSYGGYFTSRSIARHPDLYAAANTQCTLFDLVTEWQTGFTPLMSYLMGTPPTVDPLEFINDSPGFQASNVRTPTLIFHGQFDYLPVSIAKTFHEEVQAAGAPVRMLVFEDEGHGLAEPENQILAAQAQISWFRQHLAGAPVPQPAEDAADTPQEMTEPEAQADPLPQPSVAEPPADTPAAPAEALAVPAPSTEVIIIQDEAPQPAQPQPAPAPQPPAAEPPVDDRNGDDDADNGNGMEEKVRSSLVRGLAPLPESP
jgi:dipeptidyl aminopeptidase/acylaminoacyl peptidase